MTTANKSSASCSGPGMRVMENHEFGARSVTEELEELKAEATQAVAVGHDNSLDSS